MKTVYVGMSGGVDSSVTAALLKQQGYNVVGIYMKNWSRDFPGMPCPWQDDYQDAKRVAVQLGIDFKMYDFEKEYQHKVVDYMLAEYQAGRTPNPDIMCNQEVKFKLFLETALEDGADLIATGHYARLKPLAATPASGEAGTPRGSQRPASSEPPVLTHRSNTYGSLHSSAHPSISPEPKSSGNQIRLYMAKDDNKDQTYFLYRITQEALSKTLFPLGDLTKPEVRELAKKFGLVTASKKESMGICFVGKVGIKDFLSEYIKTKPGDIVDQNGKKVGRHDGAIFYTIGQRHGLDVGGGLPFYVTGKDMKQNMVYVTTDLQDKKLWGDTIKLTDIHWIGDAPIEDDNLDGLTVRTRHRAKLIPVKKLNKLSNLEWIVKLEEEVRALTPGQSAVLYRNNKCLGGGIVV
jgi:tRNA-specific 2-thiouridylase